VAALLNVSVAALRRWRLERRGPRFIKVGSLVRYRQSDVEMWLASRPVGGEPQLAGGSRQRA
jgi:excisionase family DNA binding protein